MYQFGQGMANKVHIAGNFGAGAALLRHAIGEELLLQSGIIAIVLASKRMILSPSGKLQNIFKMKMLRRIRSTAKYPSASEQRGVPLAQAVSACTHSEEECFCFHV